MLSLFSIRSIATTIMRAFYYDLSLYPSVVPWLLMAANKAIHKVQHNKTAFNVQYIIPYRVYVIQ